MTRPDLSVLIVNWRSGAMARGLIANLRKQVFTGRDGGQGALEFIVVDNASGDAEAQHLAALANEPGVTLVRSAQNSGYGAGMNMACEKAQGDYVLITNPDVMAFRGALAAMLDHVRGDDRCGMAGPKGFLDAQRFFQLPPVELPSLGNLACETLARSYTSAGQCAAEARTRRAVEVWTATGPIHLSQLSGFCCLMPTHLARTLGPFDPEYPFYFEDADLCMRLHRRGFRTDFVPRAQMVHFFNRSAGQAQGAAMARYAVSRRRFFARRYGPLGTLAYGLHVALTSGHGEGHHFAEVDNLGEHAQVPVLDVPVNGPYVAEISADPGFLFAAGRLDVVRAFTLPQAVWDGLVPATYYVRFVSRPDWKVLRTVSLTKTGPSLATDAESASAHLVHA
jgi:N-acetylglucosaminyl-diphospho-decaprenol L-rhamnosyltransferase